MDTASAPPATRTIGHLLLDYLALEGAQQIFGVPGGGIMGLLEDLYTSTATLPYIVCRHETGAAYMADGYYRASGKLGAVLVTSGPGATNAITGVMNAEAAGSAMLVMTGEVAEQYFGMGYLQEGIDGKADVNAMYTAVCASSAVVVSPSSAPRLIEHALRTAFATPRHAAHLSLPWDVTMQATPMQAPASQEAYRGHPPVASDIMVEKALTLLAAAKRPLLLIGNGCREALRDAATREALVHFADTHGIPVMTTADGKGLFPDDHPLSLRAYGLANCVWPYYWMTQTEPAYDALMVIGSGLGELATDKWKPFLQPKGAMIQLDAEARILGRDYALDLGITGEAGDFIRRLDRAAKKVTWDAATILARHAKMAAIKADHSPFDDPAAYASEKGPVHPAALCRVMQEVLADRPAVLMLDAGNCVGWGVHYLVGGPGFDVHPSLDMGPMGFSVGAVIGARLARPDAVCIAFTGDGAFMMQGSEISTAQRNNIGAIWVVLQDDDLAMVTQGMGVAAKANPANPNDPAVWRSMFSLGSPDLVKYAEGLGADAQRVETPSEFSKALLAAIAGAEEGRPQAIIAAIDRTVIPPYYTPLYTPPKI